LKSQLEPYSSNLQRYYYSSSILFIFHVCFIYEGGPYGTKFGSPEGFPAPYTDGYGVHLVCTFFNDFRLSSLQFADGYGVHFSCAAV